MTAGADVRRPCLGAAGLAALALVALGACSLPGGRQRAAPVATYLIDATPATAAPARMGGACGVLEVTPPQPAPGFDGARMLYQRSPHRLEYFAYAQWADKPALMVGPLIVSTLAETGWFSAVLEAPSPVPPDLALQVDGLRLVQRFEAETSHSEVAMSARLVGRSAGGLVGERRIGADEAAAPDPAGGVAAANRAVARVLAELREFVGEHLGPDCAGTRGAAP